MDLEELEGATGAYFCLYYFYIFIDNDFFNKTYNVFNILENDFAALRERIKYVQAREPWSMFQGLYYYFSSFWSVKVNSSHYLLTYYYYFFFFVQIGNMSTCLMK